MTGPWGAGKTSTARLLTELFAEGVVFDWDSIIPGLSRVSGKDVTTDASTWAGLELTWLAVITAVLAGGHSVVLFGPVTPDAFEARLKGVTIRCAYLDCPDAVLRRRLRARGETEANIADELQYAAELRRSSYSVIPVEALTPHEVAEAVLRWLYSDDNCHYHGER